MGNDDAELLHEFAVESQEHLADIENQLLTLESQGDNMDVALVNTVFRAIHSIKGAAGFMGLDTLGSLAHRAEEVLGLLRSNDLRPTSIVINTLLRAADRLKELIDEVGNSNGQDISSHIEALERILSGDLSDEATSAQPNRETIVAPEPTAPVAATIIAADTSESKKLPRADEQQAFSSELPNYAAANREYLIECFDNLEQLERDLLALEKSPNSEPIVHSVFRNMHSIKGASGFLGFRKLEQMAHAAENLLSGLRDGQFLFDAQISEALLGSIEVMRRILHSIEETATEGVEDHQFTVDLLGVILSVKRTETPATARPASSLKKTPAQVEQMISMVSGHPSLAAPSLEQSVSSTEHCAKRCESAKPATTEVSAADSTIRVDVALLDKLMTRVGELVLARNQILQFNSSIENAGLQNAVQRLNLITSELQEGVMKTRMQPIGNVWTKFPRLVRDLAKTCQKQCRIEMQGKETELDKTIIEAIKDPLTHLVRNTVDHGIEKPEVRRQRSKPIEGCLTLRAYHEGGQVIIDIIDDGGGLNLERIKNKAVEKSLITSEDAARMSDREAGNLIFLPGFSTAEQVSSVSGRGVGMDVVRTNIEKIGGTVDLQSQTGLGTTIKIKIPLTLAIIPALTVTADGDRYAIPQVNLLELVRLEDQIKNSSVEWIQGAPVYRLRGNLLPLVSLRDQLGLPGKLMNEAEDSLNIIVLKADDHKFGLIVDRINDSEEIVVKPLGKQIKNVPIYSGTTIMGDGRVALILDVMGLAQSARVISGNKSRTASETADPVLAHGQSQQSLLIVSTAKNRRYALPLSQVTRLEKVARNSIEYARQGTVVQYRGEIMPLIGLSDSGEHQASRQQNNRDALDVVVFTRNQRSVGLVVDRILDIVASEVALDSSIVLQDHVTDLLDLSTLDLSTSLN